MDLPRDPAASAKPIAARPRSNHPTAAAPDRLDGMDLVLSAAADSAELLDWCRANLCGNSWHGSHSITEPESPIDPGGAKLDTATHSRGVSADMHKGVGI